MPSKPGDQRPFQGLVDRCHALGNQARFENSPQSQDYIGVFGRVRRCPVDRHLIEAELVLAAAGQLAMGEGGVAEPSFGQGVEPVRIAAGVERIRHQLRVVLIVDDDAMLCEQHRVELDVEPDLEDPGRFQYRAQRGERIGRHDLVRREPGCEQPGAIAVLPVAERDIAGIVGGERERNAADLGLHRIDRVRLGLDRDMALIMHPRDQGIECVEAADGLVFVAIDRKLARGLGARSGERSRRALEACGPVLPVTLARCAVSPLAPFIPSPACGGG